MRYCFGFDMISRQISFAKRCNETWTLQCRAGFSTAQSDSAINSCVQQC